MCNTKTNISIAQIIRLLLYLKKEFNDGAIIVNKFKKIKTIVEIKVDTPLNVGPIEIEVQIMDKIILNVLVNNVSDLNIMPLSIMGKLGLQIMRLSPFVINFID